MSTPVGSITNTSPMSESSEMCETPCQIALPGVSVSTRRVSRVNPSPLLADARELRMSGGSGLTSSEPFATYYPAGACWRTSLDFCQPNLDGSLGAFCGTWPRAGTMRSGIVFQRPPLVPRTSATASGLLPTPATVDSGAYFNRSDSPRASLRPTLGAMAKHGLWPSPCAGDAVGSRGTKGKDRPDEGGLAKAVKMWPTPTAGDDRGSSPGLQKAIERHRNRGVNKQIGLRDAVNMFPTPREAMARQCRLESHHQPATAGQLNPTWVEWLMGYPAEWTALDASETPSSRKSRRGSCGGS